MSVNINERLFTMKDQEAFAKLSGDYNPMHVDAIRARRYLYGKPVVHGVHILLWVLDEILKSYDENVSINWLKTKFIKPNFLNTSLKPEIKKNENGHFKIDILSGLTITAQIEFFLESYKDLSIALLHDNFPEKLPTPDKSITDIEGEKGKFQLYFSTSSGNENFKNINDKLPRIQIATLLATTKMVGNTCPGLNSVFSDLEFSCSTEKSVAGIFSYEVTKIDKRFNIAYIKYESGNCYGNVKAFVRPGPKQQSGVLSFNGKVGAQEFSGQRALVIGGSRGIGEVTAKILAAGNASTVITYNLGKMDAENIVNEIRDAGKESSSAYLNIQDLKAEDLTTLLTSHRITHVYYFASPQILSGTLSNISKQVLDSYLNFYVLSFISIANEAIKVGVKYIFYPSTVFMDEMPKNFPEYIIMKSAGEKACELLQYSNPSVNVYVPRLPKVGTDQTSGINSELLLSPDDTIIDHLRRSFLPK